MDEVQSYNHTNGNQCSVFCTHSGNSVQHSIHWRYVSMTVFFFRSRISFKKHCIDRQKTKAVEKQAIGKVVEQLVFFDELDFDCTQLIFSKSRSQDWILRLEFLKQNEHKMNINTFIISLLLKILAKLFNLKFDEYFTNLTLTKYASALLLDRKRNRVDLLRTHTEVGAIPWNLACRKTICQKRQLPVGDTISLINRAPSTTVWPFVRVFVALQND